MDKVKAKPPASATTLAGTTTQRGFVLGGEPVGAGEILVPDAVRGLLSGKQFPFSDRGEFVPKGFDEGVRLWDVRWR